MRTFAQKTNEPQPESSLQGSRLISRAMGNQAEQALPQAHAKGRMAVPGTPAPARLAHDFSRIPVSAKAPAGIQAKLMVNTPGDSYEQEADHIASQVMSTHGQNQSQACACGGGCSGCQAGQTGLERGSIQTMRAGSGASGQIAATPIVHEVLRSPGQSLDPATRAFMEPRFGHDFSHVRVHTDARAAESSQDIQANAYTLGRDVVFGAGQYRPGTAAGNRLLAHELAHTIQQGHGNSTNSVSMSGSVIQRDPTVGAKPKAVPPPVAGGNILYIGMNNYKPEVAKLNTIYKSTSVKVTTVTVTEEETKTLAGGSTYDLTAKAGIEAFAISLVLDGRDKANTPIRDKRTKDVEALLSGQDTENRDDLAHVISVYAATDADGVDRMSRVVLSGHSYGTKVYNEDIKGAIYFDALVKLAGIFPSAAGQTKHLLVLACLAGDEDNVKKFYTKAFPSLQTFAGYTNTCPTGYGAAQSLEKWAGVTDKNPTKLDMPPSGQSNWAMGVYQSDAPVDGPALMTGLRTDEAKFNDYFNGTKVDPDNHSGFLFEYYRRARTAEQHSSTITGADHVYAQLHADQSYRLRFWPAMASNFWKKNKAAITKGYGTATVPAYGTMSRKDALAAIANFGATSNATGPDKTEAERLLKALKDLDPAELNDNWIVP
jgi:hypothetical protein